MIEKILLMARQLRPYYAAGLAALRPIESESCGTLAVDSSWRLYWSPSWVASVGVRAAALVVADHELQHLLRDHQVRGKKIDAQALPWNACADAEINDDAPELPPGCVYPASLGQPDGLLAEEYYASLPPVASTPQGCAGGSGVSEAARWELPADGHVGPSAAQGIRRHVAQEIRAAAAAQPGSVPAGALVWADAIAEPVRAPSWRTILRQVLGRACRIVSSGRDDYSWSRLPRRRHGTILRPGTVRYAPRVAVVADTSGSMVELGGQVLGHVRALSRALGCTPTIYSCDTVAHRVRGRAYIGGGGTDMAAGIAAAVEAQADIAVVITDGQTPWPPTRPNLQVVVLFVGEMASKNAPSYATTIRVPR